MSMNDYCQVFGPRVRQPRVDRHEPWCKEHTDDGRCVSKVKNLGGLAVWLESNMEGVQIIVDGDHGHLHLAVDSVF